MPSSAPGPSHYFTESPDAPLRERSLRVTLAGRDVTVTTANGIFSPGGIDKGTHILLRHAPWSPNSRSGECVLDLGCGWGPIVLTAGLSDPTARLVAVDVNERSLDLARRNARAAGLELLAGRPEDIDPGLRFDRIYSNPPIRIGKEALHDMLLTWIPRLAPGGAAWLVVQKNLGADSLQSWMASEFADEFAVVRKATDKGFRILRVTRCPQR